jgi:hypothetical protein
VEVLLADGHAPGRRGELRQGLDDPHATWPRVGCPTQPERELARVWADAVNNEEAVAAVAKALTADVHAASDDVQEAFRYMLARVALDEGLLELVSREERPEGVIRLVCQEPGTGTR